VRRFLAMATVMFCVGAGACAGGAKEQEFGTADAQAIRQVSSDLETAFNPNKPLLRGREPLKSFYNGLLTGGSRDLKISVDDVAGHGPIAYESGTYSMMNGDKHDRGKFLFILRNMAGNWKVEYTSWSSDLPPSLP
jgi:ketosteroid isomerase-like protein